MLGERKQPVPVSCPTPMPWSNQQWPHRRFPPQDKPARVAYNHRAFPVWIFPAAQNPLVLSLLDRADCTCRRATVGLRRIADRSLAPHRNRGALFETVSSRSKRFPARSRHARHLDLAAMPSKNRQGPHRGAIPPRARSRGSARLRQSPVANGLRLRLP